MNQSDGGITQWLLYVIVTVVAALFSVWNRSIMGRVEKLEEKDSNLDAMLLELERRYDERMRIHEKYERELDEKHLLMMHTELAALRKELTDGHKEILLQVHSLSREFRNGNGQKSPT